MKRNGRVIVAVFCAALLAVALADAKPKKPKPPKPEPPAETSAECIVFTGDLVGGQSVEGCCPNAGPFPAYTMSFPNGLGQISPGTYEGHIFMNNYGVGRNKKYIVQFWTGEFAVEIIGGVVNNDRKAGVLTVTFTNELCTDHNNNYLATVSFVLVRTSDESYCD
jgi:hypothetical protein